MVDGRPYTIHFLFLSELPMAVASITVPRTYNEDFLVEADKFFAAHGEVHQTMKRLVGRLKRAKIPYAIMGGMALNAHLYERMTKDVDVLLTPRGFARFQTLFVPKFYLTVPGFARRFVDRKNQRGIDI